MNKIYFINNIFDLITLHMTDHMPVDILWKCLVFRCQFLYFILAKNPYTKIICLLQRLNGLRLTHCDQRYLFSFSSCSVAGCLNPFFHFLQLVF